ncbi:SUKH-4 family immunity protein [Paenibacillus agilis]|uniref:SUKH-4 immunity protein n=1 Tax=Paenibacillus agilis TaxID=3020863 RepID=A0A559IW82_9BACL|nr:SUKH-4 family immunity protein [Paenibacillus agilis]TVX91890.1 hypothetical protein FPZ44_01725 [Paenibacillus agilis]
MEYDVREIRNYYDAKIREYDFNKLVGIGISPNNAEFMVSVGVPEEYDEFVFYSIVDFQKLLIGGKPFIKIGHFTSSLYGLYVNEDGDEFFTSSSYHEPQVYMLNKNLETFFLFYLIRHEVSTKMRKQGEYTSYNYARELSRLYEQIDPEAMKDVEGYWSHFIEDYETGL